MSRTLKDRIPKTERDYSRLSATQLSQLWGEYVERAKELNDVLEAAGASMSDADFKATSAEIDDLIAKTEAIEPHLKKARQREDFLNGGRRISDAPFQLASGVHTSSGPRGQLFVTADGRKVRAFGPGESMAQAVAAKSNLAVPEHVGARYLHACLTNDFENIPSDFLAQQTVGTDSAGGYFLPGIVSANWIDLARSRTVMARAGASFINMDTNEMTMVRVSGDPTAAWTPETATATSTNVTFERIVLRPKKLTCVVPVSVELFEDGQNVVTVLENVIASAMGLALDQAALSGTGASGEPLGIRNATGTNSIASVGTPTTYADVDLAIGDVRAANYPGEVEDLSWILHPRDMDTYSALVTGISSDNTPLMKPDRVSRLMTYETTSVATTEGGGSNESFMVVGDMSQVAIGIRTNVSIRIADDGTISDGTDTLNATSQFMKLIVCHLRADVAVLQPSWITVLTGVTA